MKKDQKWQISIYKGLQIDQISLPTYLFFKRRI